jgi:hypothetical protein
MEIETLVKQRRGWVTSQSGNVHARDFGKTKNASPSFVVNKPNREMQVRAKHSKPDSSSAVKLLWSRVMVE